MIKYQAPITVSWPRNVCDQKNGSSYCFSAESFIGDEKNVVLEEEKQLRRTLYEKFEEIYLITSHF